MAQLTNRIVVVAKMKVVKYFEYLHLMIQQLMKPLWTEFEGLFNHQIDHILNAFSRTGCC